jgi:hypothetical protein
MDFFLLNPKNGQKKIFICKYPLMIVIQPNLPINYRHELTYFRAIQAGSDFSKGDIITLTEQINQSNEDSLNAVWKNKTTGFLLSEVPAIGVDVELLENARIKLSSETLLLKGENPIGLKKIPDNANFAQVHVIGGNIIYTLDGVTKPVSGDLPLGIRAKDWATFKLEGRDELLKFQVITLKKEKNLRLYVEFSQIIRDNS